MTEVLSPLAAEILRFIRGLRGPRRNPVTSLQIERRFSGHGEAIDGALYEIQSANLARPYKQALARRGNWRDATYWEGTE